MHIRRARQSDLPTVAALYERTHDLEEQGLTTIGWIRGVYPTLATAEEALGRDALFVMKDEGELVAVAKIDQQQVPEYADCPWMNDAEPEQVLVLHTLVVDPEKKGKGYGKAFVAFYEELANDWDTPYLRMDTNERNTAARGLYRSLGYHEAGIVKCTFNGIPDVKLICLEKQI